MRFLKRIFTNWWVLSLLTAILFLLVLTLLLPLLVDAFRPASVRIAFAILVTLGWAALAAWHIISGRQAAARIASSIQAVSPDGEGATLSRRMTEALTEARRVSGRGDYLYGKPWYVIIGPPGAGKTTALTHSGLRFLTDTPPTSNIGGTRNIDFLFTDEAVLIDTAGRYTSQDSDSARDRAAWKKFLELLRRNRPLQPVNGVLIALAIDELAKADPIALDNHARIVRDRLKELQSELDLQLPVYVLFTKCDLLAGFSEFFDDLDVEGRRAVLGATLAWPGSAQPDETTWARSFDELSDAIEARMAKRLQEELDGRRRSLIVGFPVQISALRSRLVYFLSRAFASNDAESPNWPRGFYLTSGVQQGTPFDRVLGSLAAVYDAPQVASAQGRAYFVNRLLKEVIIGEAGLGKRTSKVYARERRLLIGGLGTMAALFLLLTGLWSVSYIGNRHFQNRILGSVADLQKKDLFVESAANLENVTDADGPVLGQSVPLLDALSAIPGGYAEQKGAGHSLFLDFGLYQSSLAEEARSLYITVLQRIMLPHILFRIEDKLEAGRADPQGEYNALKAYLMLGGDHRNLDYIKPWTINDWTSDEFRGPDQQQKLDSLSSHLTTMLVDTDIDSVWSAYDGRAPLDQTLIDRARADIEQTSLSERGYAIMLQTAMSQDHPWRLKEYLNRGDERYFVNGQSLVAMAIPYFFTKSGYYKIYTVQSQLVGNQLRDDAWMLGGESAKEASAGQYSSLSEGIADHYAHDYEAQWTKLLQAIQPANYFADPASYNLTADASPIKTILKQVDQNTTLSSLTTKGNIRLPGSLPSSIQRAATYLRPHEIAGTDAGTMIHDDFKDVDTFYEKGDLDAFLKKLSDALENSYAARNNPSDLEAKNSAAKSMSDLKLATAGAPALVKPVVAAAAQQGAKAQVSTDKSSLADTYDQSVKPDCLRATQDRYPFRQDGSADANPDDLTNVFSQHGEIDGFVAAQTGLQPYLDTSGAVWHWRPDAPVASGFNPLTPEEFQKAASIGELLGASGIQATVTVKEFGGDVTAAELTVGDRSLKFGKNDATASGKKSFGWSVGIDPGASIALYSSPPPKSPDNSGSAAANGSKDKSSDATSDSGTAKQDDTQPHVLENIPEDGKWAVFKLFDKAKIEQHTEKDFDATFGSESSFVIFHVTVSSPSRSPFGLRNSLWSFRCPAAL
jgi:type VI secretion system protein ImpL